MFIATFALLFKIFCWNLKICCSILIFHCYAIALQCSESFLICDSIKFELSSPTTVLAKYMLICSLENTILCCRFKYMKYPFLIISDAYQETVHCVSSGDTC